MVSDYETIKEQYATIERLRRDRDEALARCAALDPLAVSGDEYRALLAEVAELRAQVRRYREGSRGSSASAQASRTAAWPCSSRGQKKAGRPS